MTNKTTPLQAAAGLVAAVFLLVGVAGFVPGLTTHVGDMSFAGHHSDAQLLGIFQVSVLHNIVHLLFGAIGLGLARTWAGARNFLIGGGLVYAALFLFGSLIDLDSDANFAGFDSADNLLHLALAVAMVGLGLVLGRQQARVDSQRA